MINDRIIGESGGFDSTGFGNTLLLTRDSLNSLTDSFASMFGEFSDFASEISGIYWYPFSIPKGISGKIYSSHIAQTGITGSYPKLFGINYFDLGELAITNRYDEDLLVPTYLDYPPYVKAKLFLPMYGFVDIDITPFVGKFMQIRLVVNITNGMAKYLIGVTNVSYYDNKVRTFEGDGDRDSEVHFINSYDFQCGVHIPVGSTNADSVKRDMLLGALKLGLGLAGATFLGGTSMTIATQVTEPFENVMQHRYTTQEGKRTTETFTMKHAGQEKVTTYTRPEKKLRPIADAFYNSAATVASLTSGGSSEKSSSSATANALGNTVVLYLFRSRVVERDAEFNHLFGRPLSEVRKLGDLRGYTEVATLHIESKDFANITESERQMIEKALHSGVII